MKHLREIPQTALIRELIRRNKMLEAPMRTVRVGLHYEVVVGIGNDHCAFITLTDDAHTKLMRMEDD